MTGGTRPTQNCHRAVTGARQHQGGTINTTSAEGDTSDNTAVIPIVVRASGTSTSTPVQIGDGLATTGPQVTLLIAGAVFMIAAGVAALLSARRPAHRRRH